MATILNAQDSPAIAIGGTSDHVHVLFSLSKNHALAKVVEEVKSGTSKWIKTKGRDYRGFFWQTGYAAFSIGKSGEAALVRYIKNQKQHHRKTDFKDELRMLLKKYEVIYREEYLWD
jgi:REP element-mobilizing transposase RayT